jgi:hypothetical protein
MNDTSPEQRADVSSLLASTDTSTVKQLWLQENTKEFPFNEYRLNGIPDSLKTFVDQFLKEDGRYDKDRLIWTSEKSFVRVISGYQSHEGIPGTYKVHKFCLLLTSASDSRHLKLYIHSSTLDDEMSCFDFLIGLPDDHFDNMELAGRGYSRLCPLTSVLFEKMILQSAKRKNSFDRMTFTPDQSRTLATSGTRTDIKLSWCKFEDDGEVFWDALAARADPQTGLAKLSIYHKLPFAEGILVLLPEKLECLAIFHIDLETEEACRAVAEAELQYLELRWCELDGDGGAALVESVRIGRGPKGLGLYTPLGEDDEEYWVPFDSSERFVSFLNALRGNAYLERLVLSGFDLRKEGILHALAAALIENKGLVHLGLLQYCRLDEGGFCEFLRALSAHPSLRTLDLAFRDLDMDKTAAAKAVAEMLSVNNELEGIRCRDDNEGDDDDGYDSPFDPATWAALVIPRLECNIYRKRFPAIQEIRPPSTLAAVLASALAHVSNKPSPAFMLLRENVDILSSYLVDE